MRKTLVAAVALAPICLALSQRAAHATDTVSSGLSAPIATATASDGAADNIDIASGGSVTVTGTTPAVTQNSANALSIEGSVTLKDVTTSTSTTPATGVLIQNGTTFTNAGTISNTASYTASDSVNGDGVVEAPFAQGSYRIGVHGTGGTGLTGLFTNSGTITVQGNNSYGVLLENPFAGLTDSGTITLTGDNGVALKTTGASAGNVLISGGVTSTGQNSGAVNIGGAVAGSLNIYSSVTSTGYSTLTRPTTSSELTKVQGTPTDVEQGGPGVTVGASVTGGIFIGAPPVGTTTTTTADVDGDGIEDEAEGTGAVNVYGGAPALLIGGTSAITIGPFSNNGLANTESVPQTPGANDYDLIVRGSINASGVYDGVVATALQIGGLGGDVTLAQGVRVVGSINATSYDANAIAVHLESGATVGAIHNEGFIQATINHSILDATGASSTVATAYGIVIDANAAAPTITNYGYITAAATGDNLSATAILDSGTGLVASGAPGTYTIGANGVITTTGTGPVTITNTGPVTITNEGLISSVITPGLTGDTTTGTATAIDLRNNLTGVSLIQQANPNPIAIDVETTTSASGTTTTAASTTGTVSGSTVTSSGTTTSSTTTTTVTTTAAGVTTTTTSTTPTVPEIVGDVRLGSGTNSVQLLAGSMIGALDLGSGNGSSLTIDNTSGVAGAVTAFDGALTYEGTGLKLSVNNGTLLNTSATTLNLSSLNVGSTGVVYAAINGSVSTLYKVAGSATLASGAHLGIVLESPLFSSQTYTIVEAATLSNAAPDSGLLSATPYLLNATATTNAAAGTINVTVSQKTATQLGLNAGQSAALTPVLTAVGNDPTIESELLGQYTQSGFLGVYNQLLPDYAGGVFQMASAASDAITRATSRSNDIENPGGTRGAWAEEFAFGVNRPAAGAAGYRGDGFGFVGGLETGGAGLGAFGLTGSFLAGSIDTPHSPGDNQQAISEGEIGTYWQGQFKGFRADARLAGGYVYFADRRQIYEATSTGEITLNRTAKGSGEGWSGTGHFGAAYQFDFGKWFIRPNAQADYFELYEGGFTEHNGASTTGDGFDLALAHRTGRQASGVAAMTLGTSFGTGFVWRPELQVGYRDVFSGTAGATTAHFSGGDDFTLQPVPIKGGGPLARVGVKADTDFYELDFQAGAEDRNRFTEGDVRLTVRVLF